MPSPDILSALRPPVVTAPLPVVSKPALSKPDLGVARCEAGIVGIPRSTRARRRTSL